MQNNYSALKELTKKLDEIKESWQIYTIFEQEKKNFNEEFDALKKDKESLMESFNEISAKNALLLAENKELEEKNKTLQNAISAKEQQLNSLNPQQDSAPNSKLNPKEIDFEALQTQCQSLKKILKSAEELLQNDSFVRPKALEKLEVSYQKHQRLLANPAKNYVLLESAEMLFDLLTQIHSKLKILDLESSKLESQIHNPQNNLTKPQKMLDEIQDLEFLKESQDLDSKESLQESLAENPKDSYAIPQSPNQAS
ncbi:hypothetical protein [Helicobacter sp. MIT 05-5294]|uniref:hypothetical protein n=1 Tax=Helicobacter sp. MIT 05-5294 TaxID=1548150 RepID=UPI000A4867F7|nr:hypothetical protein [Helicobacter sp. MIT 05-5294]TLD87827.1 hypothetical protein LS69_003265 [Helicobacter sp. MIT 05-5294]